MIVVSDATPVNILVRIGEVVILEQLFQQVIIPTAVAAEMTRSRTPQSVRDWIANPPGWLRVMTPSVVDPSMGPGAGEREAIGLAIELHADLLLVDDRKARRAAIKRGLRITGTLGVLELAAAKGLIELPGALERLRQTDFMIGADLLAEALQRDSDRRRRAGG